jgi:hypothetical protein
MNMTDAPRRPDTPFGSPVRRPRPARAAVPRRMAGPDRPGLPVHATAARTGV